MNQITRNMFLIKTLDPDAALLLSEYTGQWYVSTRIEISDGQFLTGVAEHRDWPEEAVEAVLERLKTTGPGEYVVTGSLSKDKRRNWRWNGAGFREQI